MRNKLSWILFGVAGCLVLPSGPLFLFCLAHQTAVMNSQYDQQRQDAAVWYVLSMVISMAIFLIVARFVPRGFRQGLFISTIIDIIVSLAMGILVLNSERSMCWLAAYLAFSAVAFVDYVFRWYFANRGIIRI